MSAAELRALASELNWHVGQTFTPQHKATFAQAAELIDLLAWAEEFPVGVERDESMWCVYSRGVEYGGPTLIDTLRRAREAAK